jgi:hypothetical protein
MGFQQSGSEKATVLEHQDIAVIAEHPAFARHSHLLTRLHGLQLGE